MAPQRNTVIDYMKQKIGSNPRATATGAGYRVPLVTSRTNPSFSPDTGAPSSADTQTRSSPHQEQAVPETQADDDDDLTHMSLDDLLLSPGREVLQRLVPLSFAEDPEAGWFKLTHKVSRRIREIITSDFKDAGHNWTTTPDEVTERWFKAFAQRYNWDRIHTGIIYDEFKKNASTRLRNLVSDWKRRGKKPAFMGKKIWKRLLDHWETEEHQAKSERTSKARNNECDGLGPPVHCMGQKSFLRRRLELREKNGEFPSQIALLEDTHTRKADGVIIDLKTIRILNSVNEKIDNLNSQMPQSEDTHDLTQPQLSTAELDEIYKTVVPMKRGRRYGMGSIPESGSASSSFVPSPILSTLQTELKTTQKELGEAKNIMEEQAKLIKSMNERFKDYEKLEAFVQEKMNSS